MKKITLSVVASFAALMTFGLPLQAPNGAFSGGFLDLISASTAGADRADRRDAARDNRRENTREDRRQTRRIIRRQTRRIIRRTMRRIDRRDWHVAYLPGACVIEAISGIDFYRCGGKYYEPVLLDNREVYVIITP